MSKLEEDASALGLCGDCTAVLKRVEDLENGVYPSGSLTEKQPDPDPDRPSEGWPDEESFRESDYYKNVLEEDWSLDHKSTRTALSNSANSGCKLCQWLLESLDGNSGGTNSSEEMQYQRRPGAVDKDPVRSPLGIRCAGHYHFRIRCAPSHRSVPVYLKKPGMSKVRHAYQNYSGNEKASLIIDSLDSVEKASPGFLKDTTTMDAFTPTDSTYSLMRSWFDLCSSDHTGCRPQSTQHIEDELPARLLDIQGQEGVSLVENRSSKIDGYAVLSHCIEDQPQLQLTTNTIGRLSKGIDLSELPTLFKDTVVLCRKLGFSHLWIDSLCIIQDSVEDVKKEVLKKGSIFRNSQVCIAATGNTTSESSLFEKRDLTHKRPLVVGNLVVQADVKMANQNFFMRQITWCDRMRTLLEWGVDAAPLHRQGWALQERMFAPRIIHSTSDEFVWECCKGVRSESHPLLTNGGSVAKDVWHEVTQIAQSTPAQPAQHQKNQMKLLQRWSEFVQTYSGAHFGRLQDRLAACSAIAKLFEPVLGNHVAGLWKEFLPSQLLWKNPRLRTNEEDENRVNMRPPGRPSWSWAAVDSPVVMPHYYDASTDQHFHTKVDQFFMTPINAGIKYVVQVLNVNLALQEDDLTGKVESGEIHLRGCKMYPMYWSPSFGCRMGPDPPSEFEFQPEVLWSWDDPDNPRAAPDPEVRREAFTARNEEEKSAWGSPWMFQIPFQRLLASHDPQDIGMYCLPISYGSVSMMSQEVNGLILARVESSANKYRRVGHFGCSRSHIDPIQVEEMANDQICII